MITIMMMIILYDDDNEMIVTLMMLIMIFVDVQNIDSLICKNYSVKNECFL